MIRKQFMSEPNVICKINFKDSILIEFSSFDFEANKENSKHAKIDGPGAYYEFKDSAFITIAHKDRLTLFDKDQVSSINMDMASAPSTEPVVSGSKKKKGKKDVR